MKRCLFIFLFIHGIGFSQNLTLLNFYNYDSIHGAGLSGCWGYVDEFGNEYALVGAQNGFSILDITNPVSPVEKAFFPACGSLWREVQVYNNYAYVSTECPVGLMIVNLNPLPGIVDSTNITWFYGDPAQDIVSSAHTLFINSNGIMLYNGTGEGQIFYDLNVSATNPPQVGKMTEWYVHDAIARGDTMYCANIQEGFFTIWNISNPANPQLLSLQETPMHKTHNLALSDDGKYLFATDEIPQSSIVAYDISNLANITETDKVKRYDTCAASVHNTFFINNYLVTAYFLEGVTIHDVSNPYNMVEVAHFDPDTVTGPTFASIWGAYPYFPSGNIIISDMQKGLYILSPNYMRAALLEGNVTDAVFGQTLHNVSVNLVSLGTSTSTDFFGNYKTGYGANGFIPVAFSKTGYVTDTFLVEVFSDSTIYLNVSLQPITSFSFSGNVKDDVTGAGVGGVEVLLENSVFTYTTLTDVYGNFSFQQIFADPANDSCNLIFTKWGYHTWCDSMVSVYEGMPGLQVYMHEGYYDDFTTDLGWNVVSTATSGIFVREKPDGTGPHAAGGINPYYDLAGDCFDKAYVTGNTSNTSLNLEELDGATQLISPPMNFENYVDPYMHFDFWMFQYFGSLLENGNAILVTLHDGAQEIIVNRLRHFDYPDTVWNTFSFRLADYTQKKNNIVLKIQAEEYWTDEVFEVAIDHFRTSGEIVHPVLPATLELYPNPFYNELQFRSPVGIRAAYIYDVTGKMVFFTTLNKNTGTIQLPGLAIGMYEVKLVLENGTTEVKKLVKQ